MISVYRHDDPATVKGYPISLREPLPNIPIPLRPTNRDVILQLQPLMDDCYRDARCNRTDYRQQLNPPLSNEDATWVQSLVQHWQIS